MATSVSHETTLACSYRPVSETIPLPAHRSGVEGLDRSLGFDISLEIPFVRVSAYRQAYLSADVVKDLSDPGTATFMMAEKTEKRRHSRSVLNNEWA